MSVYLCPTREPLAVAGVVEGRVGGPGGDVLKWQRHGCAGSASASSHARWYAWLGWVEDGECGGDLVRERRKRLRASVSDVALGGVVTSLAFVVGVRGGHGPRPVQHLAVEIQSA